MNCVNCAAPLPPKTTRCPFCKTLNDIDLRGRVATVKGAGARDCPRCQEKMTAVSLQVGAESLELDRCLQCFGLFFDPGELEAILDGLETRSEMIDHRQLLTLVEQETPIEGFDQIVYVPCPTCGQLMHRRSFGQRSGVIVDTCREHGVWLDGGELRRLIRWTQAGGRRHDAAQRAEKERLEANLKTMPAVVPGGEQLSMEGSFERPTSGRWGTMVWEGLDLVDLLRALTALAARWR